MKKKLSIKVPLKQLNVSIVGAKLFYTKQLMENFAQVVANQIINTKNL